MSIDGLDYSLPENVTKRKENLFINRGESAFISLDELSNYYFPAHSSLEK